MYASTAGYKHLPVSQMQSQLEIWKVIPFNTANHLRRHWFDMLALDIKKLTDVFIQEYTHSSGKNDSLKAERLDPQVDL